MSIEVYSKLQGLGIWALDTMIFDRYTLVIRPRDCTHSVTSANIAVWPFCVIPTKVIVVVLNLGNSTCAL